MLTAILPVAEETNRQTQQNNNPDLWLVDSLKYIISLVLVRMIDVVTYHLTAIGKALRGRDLFTRRGTLTDVG